MANLNGQYDPNAEAPGTFEVFPAGPQPMELTESDIVPTNDGKGKLLKYRARITQGELEDRLVFGHINLQNPSAKATEMGQKDFRAMREVTGVLEPDDTADLHFKEFIGYVKISPPQNGYDAKNEIDWGKTFKIHTDGVESVTTPTTAAANDNVAGKTPANDNKKPAAAAPKAAAKAGWPRK